MSPAIQSHPTVSSVTILVDGAFKEVSSADYLGQCDTLPEFTRLDTIVLAISTDLEYSHRAWVRQARSTGRLGPNLRIPLLVDRNMPVVGKYGSLIEDKGIIFRASHMITMDDLPVRRSVDEVLRLVQASNLKDAHGEVCLTNWKEGSKTIRTDPLAKLNYLSAAANGAHENSKANGTKRARMDTK
ncbi:Cys 2 peroxiredoxin [Lactarius indigo]|nr:Cys 2 peroxiredoxin [Lactarius indigo]